MATRVERTGIEACITKVNAAIEQLIEASSEIETAMNDLPNYWEGAAYDNARNTYEEEYQTLLTKTVPDSVTNFKIISIIVKIKSLRLTNSLLECKILKSPCIEQGLSNYNKG